jgi:pimeloyl-ACP methyl ester carboxylesterase
MRMAWGSWKRVMYFPLRELTQQFTQAMAIQDLSLLHANHIVPAPGRIFFEAAFGVGTYVDFANDRRAPLLLIAAENDHSIRPCVVRSNYRHYNRSAASTSFKCFAGYSHWLITEPGWEQIADYTIEWAQTQLGRF